MVAPPPPREEIIGVAPTPGYIWIGGYWNWVGGRYEWVPGHWAGGRQGYHWVAHQWVRQGDGWRMRPGHWEPRLARHPGRSLLHLAQTRTSSGIEPMFDQAKRDRYAWRHDGPARCQVGARKPLRIFELFILAGVWSSSPHAR